MSSVRTKPYYGWYLAITLAVTETISWGIIYYSFSVFLIPMEADLGWTRSELTGGFSLMWLVTGLMAFPIGAWIDKHGARLLMTLGSIGASLLVIAWSMVSSLPMFYLIWIGLGVCASAVLYDPAFTVIAQWFHRRRSVAFAIVTFAAGLASTIFLPLANGLLQQFGWRTAVLLLGIFLGCVTIPLHALILRRRPSDMGLLPDGDAIREDTPISVPPSISFRHAVMGRTFWMLTLSFGLMYLAATAIRFHFIPFLLSSGIDPSTAAAATGAIGLMQVLGRVVFAPLDSRFSTHSMLIGILGLHIVASLLLLVSQSLIILILFIAIFGAAQGAGTLVRPSLIAELYGVQHYGRISSIMITFLTLTSTAAPQIASQIYDQFGNYQPVLWLVVIFSIVSTMVGMMVRKPSLSS